MYMTETSRNCFTANANGKTAYTRSEEKNQPWRKNRNQNSLLVKRQTDNTTPGTETAFSKICFKSINAQIEWRLGSKFLKVLLNQTVGEMISLQIDDIDDILINSVDCDCTKVPLDTPSRF